MGQATSKGNEVKDETPFRYAHAEIQTKVVVICGPTRYQLHHTGPHNLLIEMHMRFITIYEQKLDVASNLITR